MAITWIKVTDRLPAYGRRVMVTRQLPTRREVAIAQREFTDKDGENWVIENRGNPRKDIISWGRLPEEDLT